MSYKSPLGTFLKNSKRDLGDAGFPSLTVEGINYGGSRNADEKKQRALSVDELKLLFEGDVFRAIAEDTKQEDLYWLSVVSFFTGARPRELCQINPQVDFGEMDGHWFIDISAHTAAGKGVKKTVKTGEDRRLPLHNDLVELGFHHYLQRMKKNGADRIFPNSRVKSGNPYQVLGAKFTELLKAVELYDDTAPPGRHVLGIYVARKTFITQARDQKVISKDITGHADDGTTAIQREHYITDPEPFFEKVTQLSKFKLPMKIPKVAVKTC
jgi:integrase